jgi:putative nucleotidyltransferase with HDIG domain
MKAEILVGQVKDLSAPAPSVVRLMTLLSERDINNSALAEVVASDAVLSSKLLSLANSAYLGLSRPVESFHDAIFYLGHEEVYRLAMALSLSAVLDRKASGYAMDEGQLWRHSLLAANAAEAIVRCGCQVQIDPSVAYTAGLLHDIGKVVLNQFVEPNVQSAVDRISEVGSSGLTAERTVLGTDHCEVGACLLKNWRLPSSIVEAVAFHHQPQLQPEPQLSAIISLANRIAHQMSAIHPREFSASPECEPLGITEIDVILSIVGSELPKIDRVAGL